METETQTNEDSYRVTAAELRQIIEGVEKVQADVSGLKEIIKERLAEAKARGYDVKIIRKIIAQRKRDRDDIAEEEAVMEMYKEALGM